MPRLTAGRPAMGIRPLLDFGFVATRDLRPMNLIAGEFLAEFDGARRGPDIQHAKVDRPSVLLDAPGKYPGVAVEYQRAQSRRCAVRWNLIARTGMATRPAGEHQQDLRVSVDDLTAGEICPALPAVVVQRIRRVASLAIRRLEPVDRSLPGPGVGVDRIYAGRGSRRRCRGD